MRLVAIVSAAAYLMAVTASIALHSHVHVHLGHVQAHAHAHSHPHPSGEAGCAHQSCGHAHGHDAASSGGAEKSAPTPHHHHDGSDCPVCEFLAQMPVPAAPVELPPPRELIAPPAVLAIVSAPRLPFSAWQGRGPPASGSQSS